MAENDHPDRTNKQVPPQSGGAEVNFPLIIKIGIGLVILAVIVHIGLWWLFFQLKAREALQDQAISPLARRGVAVPPWPRLVVNEPLGLREQRQREDAVLQNYGWVNKQDGIARVPVTRAMKMYLQQQQQGQGSGGK